MNKQTTKNIDRLMYLGYRNAFEVMKAIDDISTRESANLARFNEIMYEARLNPAILANLLDRGIETGMIMKHHEVGYVLTGLGRTVLSHAKIIVEA